MSAPIGNTCPDIDKAIDILEDLRNCNSILRHWGERNESENDVLKERVEELEEEVKNLKKEIADLELKVYDL